MEDQESMCKVLHRQTGTSVRWLNDLKLVQEICGPTDCVAKPPERTFGACDVGIFMLKFKKTISQHRYPV
jgi:hypothetical protein